MSIIRWSPGIIICIVVQTGLVGWRQVSYQSHDGVWWKQILQINNHTRVQWRQYSCAKCGEDGKQALCMHTCTLDTHTRGVVRTQPMPGTAWCTTFVSSLVLRPHPAFRCLQYGNPEASRESGGAPSPRKLWLPRSILSLHYEPVVLMTNTHTSRSGEHSRPC